MHKVLIMLSINKSAKSLLACIVLLAMIGACKPARDADKLNASMPTLTSTRSSALTPTITYSDKHADPSSIKCMLPSGTGFYSEEMPCKLLTEDNFDDKIVYVTIFEYDKDPRIDFISANGKNISKAALKNELTSEKQIFLYHDKLIEVRECFLLPISIGCGVQGLARYNRLRFVLKQPDLPAEIKQFMQQHFAYHEGLANSLAYSLYNLAKTEAEQERIYRIAFIPKAYEVKVENQIYYALKSKNIAFSNQLIAEQRDPQIDFGTNPRSLVWANYCDGVYARLSYITKIG